MTYRREDRRRWRSRLAARLQPCGVLWDNESDSLHNEVAPDRTSIHIEVPSPSAALAEVGAPRIRSQPAKSAQTLQIQVPARSRRLYIVLYPIWKGGYSGPSRAAKSRTLSGQPLVAAGRQTVSSRWRTRELNPGPHAC